MADASRVVDIILQVATKGTNAIRRQMQDLAGLGRVGAQAATGMRGASGALDNLAASARQAGTQTAGMASSAAQAAQRVQSALRQIEGFGAMKQVFAETGRAMQEAQRKAADLARQLQQRGNLGAELQRGLDGARESVRQFGDALSRQQQRLDAAKNATKNLRAAYNEAGKALDALNRSQGSDSGAIARAQADYDRLGAALQRATEKQERAAAIVANTRAAYNNARRSVTDYESQVRESAKAQESYNLKAEQARAVAAQMRSVFAEQRAELLRMRQSLQEAGVSTRNLGQEQRRLQDEMRAAQARMRSDQRMSSARETLGVTSHGEIQAEITRVQRAYQTLAQSGRLSGRELAQAMRAAQDRVRELHSRMTGLRQQTDKLGSAWGKLMGLAASAGTAAAGMKLFGDFESQMLRVQALTNSSGTAMAELEQRAMELGATTRYSAGQVASAMGEAAAAGQNATQIGANIASVMHMAAAGNLDVAVAMDRLTNIMSQFGMEGEQASKRVADVMTSSFTGAATSMEQLSDALTYVGPVAAAFGYDIEQTNAVLMQLANNGFKATLGGTALRGAISRLINPTRESRKILEKYGIEVRNADGTLRDFSRIIDDFKDKGVDAAEVAKLFGQRAGPAMAALIPKGGQAIRDFEERLRGSKDAAKETADTMESGFMGSMRRLWAGIEGVAVSFGKTVAPVLSQVADMLAAVLNTVAKMPAPLKAFVSLLAGVGAGMLVWKSGLGQIVAVIRALPLLATQLRGVAGAAATAGGAVGRLQLVMTGLLRVLGGIAAAASIGWAFGEWLNQFNAVRKAGASLWYVLDRVGLAFRKMFAAIGMGSLEQVNREIEQARKTYQGLLDDIDKGRDDYALKKKREAAGGEDKSAPASDKDRQAAMAEQLAAEESGGMGGDDFDAEAEARRDRLAAIDEELADKRQAREEADFDEEMARRQRLQEASGEREDRAVDWRNRLDAQQAAQEDSHEARMAFIEAEGEAAAQLHEDKLAQIRQEAEEREKAHARTLENIKAEREELAASHQERMELLAEELKEAEENEDKRAIHAARKAQEKAEKDFERQNAKLDRAERRANEAEERARLDTEKKVADEDRSYRADRNKLEIKKAKELRAEEERRKKAEEQAATGEVEEAPGRGMKAAAGRADADAESEDRESRREEKKKRRREARRAAAASREVSSGREADKSRKGVTDKLEESEQAFAGAEQAAREMAEAQKQAAEEAARAAEESAREAGERAREWAESQRKAAEDAAKSVQGYYQRLKSASEDVAQRQKSLTEELLELDTTKSEKDKWQLLARQAADYRKQAEAAMKAGDLDKAKELADLARSSYGRLKGGAEGVDAQNAQRQAYSGVKAAGELGIAIAKLQEAQAAKETKRQVNVANALARNLGPAMQQMQQIGDGGRQRSDGPGQTQAVPVKEHVLKFAGGTLRGGESDVEALLRELERAGLSA